MLKRNMLVCKALLLAGIALPSAAFCQAAAAPDAAAAKAQPGNGASDSGPDAQAIQDIVVFAQKRGENLQRVPIAITAVTGADLAKANATDVRDLVPVTPGLQVNSQMGRSNPNFFLRGIGVSDPFETATNSVSVYYDEAIIGAPGAQIGQFYDLDRVEVLRGPQGTLFGRNTSGGAVSLFSKLPGREVEGYARIGYGNYNDINLEAAVTVPLTETLSVRFAGTSENRDGWMRNVAAGLPGNGISPREIKSAVNNLDYQAGRAILLFKPTANFTATLNANIYRDRSDGYTGNPYGTMFNAQGQRTTNFGYVTPSLKDWRTTATDVPGKGYVDAFGTTLKLSWSPASSVNLTSITSLLNTNRLVDLDSDHSSVFLVFTERFAKTHQLTEELRASSSGSGPLRWVTGFYLFDEKMDGGANIELFQQCPACQIFGGPAYLLQRFAQHTESYAGFGQVDYSPADKLTLTAGVRYTTETKHFTASNAALANGSPTGAVIDLLLPFTVAKTENALTWRGALNYQVDPRVLLYASMSKGVKTGGFPADNLNAVPAAYHYYGPETVMAFELGEKGDFFDHKVRLNLAAFYNRYRDMQVLTARQLPGFILPTLVTDNAARATTYGVDAEGTVLLTKRLKASLSLEWLEAHYGDYVYTNPAIGAIDYSGNRLIEAPRFSGQFGLDYSLPLGPGAASGKLDFHGDVQFKSRMSFDPSNAPDLTQPAYQLYNFSLTWTHPRAPFTLTAYVKNAFNKRYLTFADALGIFAIDEYFFGTPRTFGLKASYSF